MRALLVTKITSSSCSRQSDYISREFAKRGGAGRDLREICLKRRRSLRKILSTKENLLDSARGGREVARA